MLTNNKHEKLFRVCLHLFFIALSALFIIPMLSVIFIAFTSESSISTQGYPFFFREINLNAFQYILDNQKRLLMPTRLRFLLPSEEHFSIFSCPRWRRTPFLGPALH